MISSSFRKRTTSSASELGVSYRRLSILVQALHHDPIEISSNRLVQPIRIGLPALSHMPTLVTERACPSTGLGRIILANYAKGFIEGGDLQLLFVEWCAPGY